MDNRVDPRKVFGKTLLEIGRKNDQVVVVSADAADGSGMRDFFNEFPARSFELGISEQNVISVCAGLTTTGKIPVVSAIAPFITMRCFEQVRNDVAYVNANVKIIGSSAGLAHSTMGSTHQAIEDNALMNLLPNMVILNPADRFDIEQALKTAIDHHGPVYIRMARHPLPDLSAGPREFLIGKASGIKAG
ncbi:MAG: transketolase family protein [Bacillota bacterium]